MATVDFLLPHTYAQCSYLSDPEYPFIDPSCSIVCCLQASKKDTLRSQRT